MAEPRQDREAIHREYVTTDISTRALARKHGVAASTINRWIAREGWTIEKKAYLLEAAKRAKDEIARDQGQEHYVAALAQRAKRIYCSADLLLDKVDQLLELEDALAPRDLKSISSTLLDIKMIHDIGPQDDGDSKSVVVRLAGDLAAMSE